MLDVEEACVTSSSSTSTSDFAAPLSTYFFHRCREGLQCHRSEVACGQRRGDVGTEGDDVEFFDRAVVVTVQDEDVDRILQQRLRGAQVGWI